MLDWNLVGIGLGIGLVMAAPIGPANILVIHRGVQRGFKGAFVAGMGAMAGDGLYATVAAFGVTAVSDVIEGHIGLIKLIGGILLIAFALIIIIHNPHPERGVEKDSRRSHVGAAVLAFFLVVANPGILIGFAALFAGLDKFGRGPDDFVSAGILSVSALAGSFAWWLMIAFLIARFRGYLTARWIRLMNIGAGLVFGVFGVVILCDVALYGL